MYNTKYIVGGFIASSILDIGSITLTQVNAILQTVSLVVGISLGTITLFHAFRRNDWKRIEERLSKIEGRCSANHPRTLNQRQSNP